MAFRDFGYPDVFARLGLTDDSAYLFASVSPVPPGPIGQTLALACAELGATANTEAARATWMVGPVLADLWARYRGDINLSAGAEFAADPDDGLTGYVDFVIGRAPQSFRIVAPAVVVVEAKKDNIVNGFGQCVAAMVGAQRFNRREGRDIDPVWGCSTTGTAWRFLRLSGTAVTVDRAEYTIRDVDKLLGILTHMVGPPPAG